MGRDDGVGDQIRRNSEQLLLRIPRASKGQAKHRDANHTSAHRETGRLGARHCHWGDNRLKRSSLAPEKGQQTTPLRDHFISEGFIVVEFITKTKQERYGSRHQENKFRWHTPLSLPHSLAWRSRFDSCPPLPRCHPLPVPSYDICSAWSSGKTVSPRPLTFDEPFTPNDTGCISAENAIHLAKNTVCIYCIHI